MLGLAVAQELERAGFGTYGETIYYGISPILADGTPTGSNCLWVNSNTVGVSGDLYTDTVTISTRFEDPFDQDKTLLKLCEWVRGNQTCVLSCKPIADISFQHCEIQPPATVNFSAVDDNGRFIKELVFPVRYKLPEQF